MAENNVCIIGAGSSGIACAKTLHQRGIPFDCFEKGSGVGGLWRYKNDSGTSSAYASLHINTSKRKMQYSDFPMPREYPDFPHHSQILQYFEDYVDHFAFRDKITFGSSVERVHPHSSGWLVTTRDIQGATRRRHYQAVLVANGHHWCPSYPSIAGNFDGETLHSHDYRVPDPYRDQRVVVVGMGNSACDIACELARVAKKTVLIARRGVHVIPKYLFGRPLDTIWPEKLWRSAPFWLTQAVFSFILRLTRGRLSRFQIPQPEHRILEEHPTISADLCNLIGHGRIHVKPAINKFTGSTVHFADGSHEEADTVICATGYRIVFPFLDDDLVGTQNNEVRLYKNVVPPHVANLFFIGLVQPWGAIMPLAELQGEWVADLIEGKTVLPGREEMLADIDKQRRALKKRYTASPRHTIQVDYWKYWDELQKERRRRPKIAASVETPDFNDRRKAA